MTNNLFYGAVLVGIAVGLMAFVSAALIAESRQEQHKISMAHVAPMVEFMEVGQIGWVARYEVKFDLELTLRVDRTARVERHASPHGGAVRIMRLESGVCIDPATLGTGMMPTYRLQWGQTIAARECDGSEFTHGFVR